MTSTDIRAEAAQYYDLSPDTPDDVEFYRSKIPSPDASVLELGCGTGRVLIPLAKSGRYIHGIEKSSAMLDRCREKLSLAGIPPSVAHVELGNITSFRIDRSFDLIIAPFRVFQNLETDKEVDGLLRCVRTHLSPQGSCILNVFRPYGDADTLRRDWCSNEEKFRWEVPFEDGTVTFHDRRPRMDRERLVLYPELIYRRYRDDQLIHTAVLKIAMRCYYPDDLERLIVDRGFRIVDRWGGYAGEEYGMGPELIIQFDLRA